MKYKADTLMNRYFTGDSIHYRQIIGIIVPILADQAFVVLFNLMNTAMISSSGVAAVSAVSMVDSLNTFLMNVFIAVSTGGTVVVAQYKGSGNEKKVSEAAGSAISTVAAIGIIISAVIIIFHTTVLNLLFGKAEADVFANAKVYLIGSGLSYPCFAIIEAACGALRGASETKSSLQLSLVNNFSYMLLNLIFINGMHLGVVGLVISLNLSRLIGMVYALWYLIKRNQSLRFHIKQALRFNFSIQQKILFIGLPFAAEQLFFHGGKILTQTFIVQLGTLALTINAICNSLDSLIQIAANSLCLSVVTVVGQCMGRRNIKDARKFIKSFLGLSSLSLILCGAIILPAFPILVRMFSPPDEIIPTVFIILLITAVTQPFFWSASFITPAALRAAGDSKFTSVTSMLTMWLVRVILGYILGIVLNFGITGVWVAMICEWVLRGAIFLIRLKGSKWYCHHLID